MTKKLKIITIVLCVITITSCKNKRAENKKESQTEIPKKKSADNSGTYAQKEKIIETTSDSQIPSLIDIQKELKLEWGDYIVRFNDSILSLCNEQNLYNPFLSFDQEEVSKYLTNYEIKIDTINIYKDIIFSKDNSSIRISHWESEQNGRIEIYLGKGTLKDTSVTLPNGIKIGMEKENFLSKHFITPNYVKNELKRISICPDERGEIYTKYHFDKGKLSEIEFGSINEK